MASAKKGKGKATPKGKMEATPMDTEETKVAEARADEEVVVEFTESAAEDPKASEEGEDAEEKDEEEDHEDEEGDDEGEDNDEEEEGAEAEGDAEKIGDEKKSEDKAASTPKAKLRKRGKKAQKGSGKVNKADDFAGLIFMCNEKTKTDCFKYRVFGLPEGKKSIVERVKKNDKLFLFDVDKKILYGVYKASSDGGENLVNEAFASSGKKFPAQVRFQIHKECEPLDESKFKQAIKENYFGRNKFKCELTTEQVNRLIQLFRRIGGPTTTPKSVRGNKQAGKFSGPRSNSRSGDARPAWRPRLPDIRRERRLYAPAYIQDPYVRDDLRPHALEPVEVPVRARIAEDPYLLKRPIYRDELYAADALYSRPAAYGAYAHPYGGPAAAWPY